MKIKSLSSGRGLDIVWADNKVSRHHWVWLRDHCSKTIHRTTTQKMHSSGSIHRDTVGTASLLASSINVAWKGGDTSVFDTNWLFSNRSNPTVYSASKTHKISASNLLWDRQQMHTHIKYSEFTTKAGLMTALKQLNTTGLVFLTGVPTDDEKTVIDVARTFGIVKTTFYGESWAVKNQINSKNIAYTNYNLELHMDLMYFQSPPALQFLHCLENSVKGGVSTFADSYHAARILQKENKPAFDILCTIPVTFIYENDGHKMKCSHTTIENYGEDLIVNYAPPFQGILKVPYNSTLDFYDAFREFESIIKREDMVYRRLYEVGDLAIFANRRVLHGRDAFSSENGVRHLRGCYVGVDEYLDTLAMSNLIE